jgi:hypothetical protein
MEDRMLPTSRRLTRWLASPLLAFSAWASLPAQAEAERVIVVPPAGGAIVIHRGRVHVPHVHASHYGVRAGTHRSIERGEHALSHGHYDRARWHFERAIAHEARHAERADCVD